MFDTTDNPFMTPQELCERYNNLLSPDTFEKWRRDRMGPSYYKFGGKVLYRLSDVLIWEHLQRRTAPRRHHAKAVWPTIKATMHSTTELERRIAAAVDNATAPRLVNWREVIDEIVGVAA